MPKSPFALGRVAAVGRHDLSRAIAVSFWLSAQVHLPLITCRFPSGPQSLFEQPGSQQTEHAMSAPTLIAAERKIDDNQGTPASAHHSLPMQQHHIESYANRTRKTVQHHTNGVADQ